MPLKDIKLRRAYTKIYMRQWRLKNSEKLEIHHNLHKEEIKVRRGAHYKKHRKEIRAKRKADYAANIEESRSKARVLQRRLNVQIKLEVLSHYSPDGKLRCSWPDCDVMDIDMLSLDHINNDGAESKRSGGQTGIAGYRIVKRNNYPDGYQTLCHNHQMKKEIMRVRAAQIL